MKEIDFYVCLSNIRHNNFHRRSLFDRIRLTKRKEFSTYDFYKTLENIIYLYAYALEYNQEPDDSGIDVFLKYNLVDETVFDNIQFTGTEFYNDIESIMQYLNDNDSIYMRDVDGWKWRMKWKNPQ